MCGFKLGSWGCFGLLTLCIAESRSLEGRAEALGSMRSESGRMGKCGSLAPSCSFFSCPSLASVASTLCKHNPPRPDAQTFGPFPHMARTRFVYKLSIRGHLSCTFVRLFSAKTFMACCVSRFARQGEPAGFCRLNCDWASAPSRRGRVLVENVQTAIHMHDERASPADSRLQTPDFMATTSRPKGGAPMRGAKSRSTLHST